MDQDQEYKTRIIGMKLDEIHRNCRNMRTAVPPDSFLDFSDSSARIILPHEERGHVIDPHYGEPPPWGRADTSRVSQEKGIHYHWPPEEAIILGEDSDNNNVIGDDSRMTGTEDDRIIVSHDRVINNAGGDSHPTGKEHL